MADLVTGGGSGLGEMMASSLVQASRKEKQLREVSERLTMQGPGKCEYIIADLGSKAGCDALVAEVKKRTDVLHILVNNSGTTWGAPYDDFPEASGWDRVLSTNVKAIFYMTSGLTPLLAKEATNTSPGRVVNISSVASLDPRVEGKALGASGTGTWSYATSKAAVNHLTTSLAVSLGPQCITVNAILPGVYPSKMSAFGFTNGGDAKLAAYHPMGRVGAAEDIGGLLLFLVARSGAHVTGQHIETDGGARIASRASNL